MLLFNDALLKLRLKYFQCIDVRNDKENQLLVKTKYDQVVQNMQCMH